jgi:hypothetical protein
MITMCEGGQTMATDPDVQRELDANQQRKRVIDQNEDPNNDGDGDPIDSIDDAYQSFVEPPLMRNHPSEAEEEEQRRIQNDEQARTT